VGTYRLDEDESINKWLGDDGWYEFKDVSDTDKWLADYHSFQQENKPTVSTVQTMLF
jgi:hypothetical protein